SLPPAHPRPPLTRVPYTTLFRSVQLASRLALIGGEGHARVLGEEVDPIARHHQMGVVPVSLLLRDPANELLQKRLSLCPAHLGRSEEHTSELQSLAYLVCRLLLE